MAVASLTQPQAPPLKVPTSPDLKSNEAKPNGSAVVDLVGSVSREIPIALIVPSKTNPRKTFDGPEFDELVASVEQLGVLQPVLVRPHGGWKNLEGHPEYELVCGERRFRAASKAGHKSIPAMVREFTDAQVLEVQIVENLQRQDVTALEEADGYQRLFLQMQAERVKAPRQELVGEIAKKIGKSVRYVYARMKLSELHPDVKKAVAAGEIPVSHADLLVRLQPNDQKAALKQHCFTREWDGKGNVTVPASVRSLKYELEQHFQCSLSAAKWKWDDDKLLPLAGSCNACPKNSANEPGGDAAKAICIDRACFGKKREAFLLVQIEGVKKTTGIGKVLRLSAEHYSRDKNILAVYEWGSFVAQPGSCGFLQAGIVIDGKDEGKTVLFCKANDCKVHRKGSPRSQSSSRSSSGYKPPSAAEKAKDEADRKRKDAVLLAQFRAAIGATNGVLGSTVLDLLIDLQLDFIDDDLSQPLAEAIAIEMGWPSAAADTYGWLSKSWKRERSKLSAAGKSKVLFAILTAHVAAEAFYDPASLHSLLNGLKLDPKKLADEAGKQFDAQTSAQTKKAEATSSVRPRASSAKGGATRTAPAKKPKAAKPGKAKAGRK